MKRKKIKSGWLEYFNFSARERKGTAFLSLIIIVQIAVLTWLRNRETEFPPVDQQLVKKILAMNETKTIVQNDSVLYQPISLQPFDPNRINNVEASDLGLSARQTKVIQNYLSKGGIFKTKKDFKKMYCIPDNQYKKLEPFLLLPDSFVKHEKKK